MFGSTGSCPVKVYTVFLVGVGVGVFVVAGESDFVRTPEVRVLPPGGVEVNECPDAAFDVWLVPDARTSAIQSLIMVSNSLSGTAPALRTTPWKSRMSNFEAEK